VRSLIKRIASRCIEVLPVKYRLPLAFAKSRALNLLDEELKCLPDIIGRSGVAVDVGANIGLYSYQLSQLCDRVVAFEPNPMNCQIIQGCELVGVDVYCVALSSGSGSGELQVPVVNGQELSGHAGLNREFEESKTLTVPLHQLDEFSLQNVSFMKIDVEGHELEVLKGSRRTIERNRPIILCEIELRHLDGPMTDVFDEMLGQNYLCAYLSDRLFWDISTFDAVIHQRVNGPAQYINNFFFFPEERDHPKIMAKAYG
jgi:FkbM family methyltransferase